MVLRRQALLLTFTTNEINAVKVSRVNKVSGDTNVDKNVGSNSTDQRRRLWTLLTLLLSGCFKVNLFVWSTFQCAPLCSSIWTGSQCVAWKVRSMWGRESRRRVDSYLHGGEADCKRSYGWNPHVFFGERHVCTRERRATRSGGAAYLM
jgi:hypothetical protein